MIEFRARLWRAVGAATLLSAGALVGCGPGEHGEQGEAAVPASVSNGGEAGESGAEHGGSAAASAMAGLGALEQQALAVALMRSHLMVAQALVGEGEIEAAAPHFAHPIYEVFEAHRAVFAAVRATPPEAPFDALNAAAAAGRPAEQIAPLYKPAEDALRSLQPNAAYDHIAVIRALLASMHAEYGEGVRDGLVVNPLEYQDAYGMAQMVRALCDALPGQAASVAEARKEAAALAALFVSAKPPAAPAPTGALLAQSSRLELALSGQR